MASSLLKFRRNQTSQNGEDGVLAEILKRLEIQQGTFCEFGAWDGKHLSNTYALLERGWKGIMIEGDPERFEVLKQTASQFSGRLQAVNASVAHEGTENKLDQLLGAAHAPEDFDVLSIDIDSHDWHVWRSLEQFKPKVVIIEINSAIRPGSSVVHGTHDHPNGGSSFTATLELGKQKGYTLLAHTGNMFFARNDLLAKLAMPQSELDNPDSLFLWDWVYPPNIFKRAIRKLKRTLQK